MAQGYLKKNESGRYSISEAYELTSGEGVEVKTPNGRMKMWVEHVCTDYFLVGDNRISFYPKRVCVRSL